MNKPKKKISKKRAREKTKIKKIKRKTIMKKIKKPLQENKKISKRKKDQSEKRVLFGIKNIDLMIGGGFYHNTTNLVVGNAGSGKTILATQFLIGGMKKGEKCLYVTFEEKKNQFYKNMLQLGLDLADYEKRGLLTFLEYTPLKVKTMLEEGGGSVENIILKKKIKRIVIDSITSFSLLFDKELEKRQAALSLFDMIRKWNCTSLLTYEGKPIEGAILESRTLEFESDSIIILYFITRGDERKRYIEILKMRGTKHSMKTFEFFIKNGIQINKRPVKIERF
jgi:circadian clock protein KaiC